MCGFPRSASIRTQSQRDRLQLVESMWRGNGGQLRKGRCLKHKQPWGRRVSPGYPPHLSVRCSSLKMCTVSVLLEAHRNWESMLNTRELMFTYLGPRRHGLVTSWHVTECDLLGFVQRRGQGGKGPIQREKPPAWLLLRLPHHSS